MLARKTHTEHAERHNGKSVRIIKMLLLLLLWFGRYRVNVRIYIYNCCVIIIFLQHSYSRAVMLTFRTRNAKNLTKSPVIFYQMTKTSYDKIYHRVIEMSKAQEVCTPTASSKTSQTRVKTFHLPHSPCTLIAVYNGSKSVP